MAAYRGSCSRSSASASAATTRSFSSRSTNHFTGSSYQQKPWIRSWVMNARPCSPAIHSSAARASSAAPGSCSASFARAAAVSLILILGHHTSAALRLPPRYPGAAL